MQDGAGNIGDLVEGNLFDKYRSNNPIHKVLMNRFLDDARDLLHRALPATVLEVGCGPGDLAANILPAITEEKSIEYLGTDISSSEIETAKQRYPDLQFEVASATALCQPDESYDIVIACEVLEHVDDPAIALRELARVSRRYVLVSVPWEPMWRVLNCARGKYLSRLGNTPGHVQHFSRTAIRRLTSECFQIVEERHPFPWTMLLLEK